jgi:hypothetical protein
MTFLLVVERRTKSGENPCLYPAQIIPSKPLRSFFSQSYVPDRNSLGRSRTPLFRSARYKLNSIFPTERCNLLSKLLANNYAYRAYHLCARARAAATLFTENMHICIHGRKGVSKIQTSRLISHGNHPS